MSLADLSKSLLRLVMKLLQRKQAVIVRLEKIDQLILKIGSGTRPLNQAIRVRRRSRRGGRKSAILKSLKVAGKQGLTIRQIAEKVGSSYSSVSVWFSITGKKMDGIEKIAPATYRYTPSGSEWNRAV
jgi:hypothetical protein